MPFIDASEITARKNYILTINNFIPICKDLSTDGKIHMRSRETRRGVQFWWITLHRPDLDRRVDDRDIYIFQVVDLILVVLYMH